MNAIFVAAKEVCDFMEARRWEFCVIGGLAVQRWGEPRLTQDADLTLLTGFGKEERFARALLEQFQARRPDALAFALMHRVLLIRASNGKDVDIALGGLRFEMAMVRRSTPFEFAPGFVLPTCSAEDLFVMKAFAGRPLDWIDAEGIVARQQGRLDAGYILRNLRKLCELKETPDTVVRTRKLLKGKS
jgi:hypothetical protein